MGGENIVRVHCNTYTHITQVILYGLMLADRHPTDPPTGGLLLYLKANHMQGLTFHPHEKRGEGLLYMSDIGYAWV